MIENMTIFSLPLPKRMERFVSCGGYFRRCLIAIFFGMVMWALPFGKLHAQVTIEGAGAESRALLVAIPILTGDSVEQSGTLQNILLEDFRLSGLFEPVASQSTVDINTLRIADWRGKSDFLMAGKIETPAKGSAFSRTVVLRLFDVTRGEELEGLRVNFDTRQVAIAGHQIADALIERMIGVKMGFSQLLAMVVRNGSEYSIRVSDILGKNSHSVLTSTNPIISLAWSPDGAKLAYASFENGPSRIYLQNVSTGMREMLPGDFESMSAPAWSPDGKKIAFAAFTRGRTAIYEYDTMTRQSQPLVDEGQINTEPAYSIDGFLYFSSNRGASPQIYRMNLSTRTIERFSFQHKNSIRPNTAKNQPWVAFLNREGAGVTIVNSANNESKELPLPARADGVAISNNGRLLLVSVAQGQRFQTIITNTRGSYSRRLEIPAQQFYEPAWRP